MEIIHTNNNKMKILEWYNKALTEINTVGHYNMYKRLSPEGREFIRSYLGKMLESYDEWTIKDVKKIIDNTQTIEELNAKSYIKPSLPFKPNANNFNPSKQVNIPSENKPKSKIAGSVSETYYSGDNEKKSYMPLYFTSLITSDNYRTLKPTEQMILNDIMSIFHMVYSMNENADGIHYTYKDCRLMVAYSTFWISVNNLAKKGFIEVRREKMNKCNRIYPCCDWKTYELTEIEQKEIKDYEDMKTKYVEKNNNRLENYKKCLTKVTEDVIKEVINEEEIVINEVIEEVMTDDIVTDCVYDEESIPFDDIEYGFFDQSVDCEAYI